MARYPFTLQVRLTPEQLQGLEWWATAADVPVSSAVRFFLALERPADPREDWVADQIVSMREHLEAELEQGARVR